MIDTTQYTLLSHLLAVDQRWSAGMQAIPECFGDSYLTSHNPVCCAVRRMFKSLGGQFLSEQTDLQVDYQVIPLFCIDRLMELAVVPFRHNSTAIARLVRRCPDLDTRAIPYIGKNHLLHESAHIVAYSALAQWFGADTPARPQSGSVLLYLLCEAYANTVERIGATFIASPEHTVFYGLNSYAQPSGAFLLRRALPVLGFALTFSIGLMATLRLNINHTWSEADIEQLLSDWRNCGHYISQSDECVVAILLRHGFSLNTGFTAQTTPIFFEYIGRKQEYDLLCSQGVAYFNASLARIEGLNRLLDRTCREVDVAGCDLAVNPYVLKS